MFSPENPAYLKKHSELRTQLWDAQKDLSSTKDANLIPPSQFSVDVLNTPIEEIKAKFPKRYEIYLELLRNKRRKEHHPESEHILSEEEIEKMRTWLRVLNSLDTYIENHHDEKTESTLYEPQAKVFESIRTFLEQGGTEGYVKLPTGSGKTVLFAELVEAMDIKTLVVVPTNILVDQTKKRFGQFAENVDVGIVNEAAKEFDRQVTITTYASLTQQIEKGGFNPMDYTCLVLDEAHVALSKERQDTIKQFTGAIKLGFTATPVFSQEKQVQAFLGTKIHDMSIREAIEDEGMLCSVSSIVAQTSVDISGVPLSRRGALKEKELEKAVNILGRNKAAVELYEKTFSGERALVYCIGIAHAVAVAKLFREKGISAAAISEKTPKKDQDLILEQFHSGEITVLCNADLLMVGFDEPRVGVCLNLRPTQSRVMAEQRAGRVLRRDTDNPNKHAYIVDFLDAGLEEKNRPVLFADVADGAEIISKPSSGSAGGAGGGGRRFPPIIDIEGLEVITEVDEIMKIVGQSRERIGRFLSYEELQEEVRALNITSEPKYLAERKKTKEDGTPLHPNWPSQPRRDYSEWKNWYVFLGKPEKAKVPILSYEELQAEARALGISSSSEYFAERKKTKKDGTPLHPNWPALPSDFYSEWMDWYVFCEKAKKIPLLSYTALQEDVRIFGITSNPEYDTERKKTKEDGTPLHPNWPFNPQPVYSEWKNWHVFLGKPEKVKAPFLSYEELQAEVRALKIDSASYNTERKKTKEDGTPLHPNWPASPHWYYSEWKNWYVFLGKPEKVKVPFLSYEELQAEVRALNITSQPKYLAERKKTKEDGTPLHPNWPAHPRIFYPEWTGWYTFLGKEKK